MFSQSQTTMLEHFISLWELFIEVQHDQFGRKSDHVREISIVLGHVVVAEVPPPVIWLWMEE